MALAILDITLPILTTALGLFFSDRLNHPHLKAGALVLGCFPLVAMLLDTHGLTRQPGHWGLLSGLPSLGALMLLKGTVRQHIREAAHIAHQHLQEGVFRVSRGGRLLYVNRAFLRLFGYRSMDELLQVDVRNLYANPEERAAVWKDLSEFLEVRNREVAFRRKDGTIFWGLLNSVLFVDEETGEELSDGSILDITEQKRLQEELHRLHDGLVAGFQALPIGTVRLDEHARILQVNEAFTRILKLDASTLEGQLFYEALLQSPHLAVRLPECIIALDPSHPEYRALEFELTFQTSEGDTRTMRLAGNPVFDENETFLYYLIVLEDITAIRAAEQQEVQRRTLLQRQHQQLHQLVRALSTCTDATAFFREVTETVARRMNVERVSVWLYTPGREAIECQDVYLLNEHRHDPEPYRIEQGVNPAYFQALEEGMAIPAPEARTHPATRDFGVYLEENGILSMLDAPIWLEGNVAGVLCLEAQHRREWLPEEILFASNVAELLAQALHMQALREARQQAEAISRIKSSILDNISHEIRTPLTGILGFAEILREELTEPELREFTEIIEQNGRRLLDTLTTLIELSRLESGELQPQPVPLDLSSFIQEQVHQVTPLARMKGLEIRVHTPEEPSLQVRVDPHLLQLVLRQLLENAVKFTPEGSVTVTLREQDRAVEIEVSDTGVGISEAFQPYIFDSFTQESTGNTRRFEGTGLGLHLVKRLLDRMDGSIRVESQKDVGSRFTIRLPVPSAQHHPSPSEASAPPIAIGSVLPVLVVEDNPSILTYVRYLLMQQGLEVHTAQHPDEARQHWQQQRYGLILMDIHLGKSELAGEELLRELKDSPEHRDIPVVALTAYAMPQDRERFLEQGFAHYLAKPFTREALYQIVHQYYPEVHPPSLYGHDPGAGTSVWPH